MLNVDDDNDDDDDGDNNGGGRTWTMSHVRFCAHLKSSSLGLQPVSAVITVSSVDQNLICSSGQFSQPVVMQ